MGRGLHTVPLCALPRHASVGSREQVQRPLPPPRRPPAPGGRRAALVAPQLGGVRGGGCGGPFGPLAMPPDGRGGGGAWQSWPRGPAIGWGVAPFPRPPLPRVGSSCRPSLGPLIPLAVVARRWQAGGGREG